jgi:hypothetical protein
VATPSPTGRGNRSSSLIALRNTLPFLFFTRRPAAAQGNPVHRGGSLSLWERVGVRAPSHVRRW